jgi:hypothetical protein
MRIHDDGKRNREETQAELMARESELKQKLQA